MADLKISQLPAATTPVAGTEVLPIVQSSATKQVSIANLTAGRAVSAASLSLTGSALPATSGGTGSATAFTANGVAYASSTSAMTTGANLSFDGTNLQAAGTMTGAGLVSSVNGTQLTLQRLGPSAQNYINCGGSGELAFTNSSANAFTLYNTFAFFPTAATTGSAANAFINNGSAGYANQILRSTSSIKFKQNVEDLQVEFSKKIFELRPIWYRSTAEADRKDWSWYGLVAEEVAAIEPRLVHWTYEDTQYEYTKDESTNCTLRTLKAGATPVPDGVQYERLSVLLLKELQALRQEFDAYVAAHP